MKLNVIIPVYNEEENIKDFYNSIIKVLKNIDYKLLFINDGSTDKSAEELKVLYQKDKQRVRIINFSRNFGKEAALYAGFKNSNAEYTAIIDADLQQDPKYLLEMMNELENDKNIDSICMIQKNNKKRFFQKNFYRIINKLSKTSFVNNASDFRMVRNYVVKSIISISEKNRFSKGLFSWIGFNTKYLPYKVKKRNKGTTKWTFIKLLNYSVDGFTGFTTTPLKLATYSGLLSSLSAFIYLTIIIIKTIVNGKDIPGYASIVCLILFIGGIQLLCIGILGEYISKTYIEAKNRPIYIEKNKIGFDEEIL